MNWQLTASAVKCQYFIVAQSSLYGLDLKKKNKMTECTASVSEYVNALVDRVSESRPLESSSNTRLHRCKCLSIFVFHFPFQFSILTY